MIDGCSHWTISVENRDIKKNNGSIHLIINLDIHMFLSHVIESLVFHFFNRFIRHRKYITDGSGENRDTKQNHASLVTVHRLSDLP